MELQIRNVTKTDANGAQALAGIGLTVAPGMFGRPAYGLRGLDGGAGDGGSCEQFTNELVLGPDGAGESSVMRAIATLQKPDAGTVHRGDIDVVRQKDELRRNLGYLPQEFGVWPRRRPKRPAK